MLDEMPNLACFMGWLFQLNLVLSTEFGRLAQRQSIGLTLRSGLVFQTRTNLQPIKHQKVTAGSRKAFLAQQPSISDRPIIPVIGKVQSVSGNTISVVTEDRVMEVMANANTEAWKGKTTHNLSQVQIEDDFAARCRTDDNGRLVAEAIWLNLVNFPGVITKVGDDSFEMLTNPNADPQSAYVKEMLKVIVDADTEFDNSAKEDLKVGRGVQLVGLDLKDGTIRATRVTVYEGNRPVRMKNPKIIPPTGPSN
jgi:hypothetical protein